mmetsp:Transcript_23391/g.26219  ORF Transcript_23391/g.26219 Transcript_23391/m.26219 type:complete len:431 (-) Transcript_23391:1827-3119(-)
MVSNCRQNTNALAAAIAANICSLTSMSTARKIVSTGRNSSASSLNDAMNISSNSNRNKIRNAVLSETVDDGNGFHQEISENDEHQQHRCINDDDELQNEAEDTIINNIHSEEDDIECRVARSRERNREHARRTRKRKKAQLEALQEKVIILQGKNKSLKQNLEDCSIASILIGLSFTEDGDSRDATIQSLIKEASELESKDISRKNVGGEGTGAVKRKRVVSDASDTAVAANSSTDNAASFPLKLEINGQTTLFGGDGRTHINWKNGIYTDDNGSRSQLTKLQLESLRRERNRIHAKMTRDRKKSFIATIVKTIEELESSNQRMNAVLQDVLQTKNNCVHKSFSSTKLLTSRTPITASMNIGVLPDMTSMKACAISVLELAAPILPFTDTHHVPVASPASSSFGKHKYPSDGVCVLPLKKRIRYGISFQS